MSEPAIQWRPLYEAAVLETDNLKLPEKIGQAETAMKLCLAALDGQPSDGEATALKKAMDALERLRVERLSAGT